MEFACETDGCTVCHCNIEAVDECHGRKIRPVLGIKLCAVCQEHHDKTFGQETFYYCDDCTEIIYFD
jgi:hypothetical protein